MKILDEKMKVIHHVGQGKDKSIVMTTLRIDMGLLNRIKEIAKRKCVTQESIFQQAVEFWLTHISKTERGK